MRLRITALKAGRANAGGAAVVYFIDSVWTRGNLSLSELRIGPTLQLAWIEKRPNIFQERSAPTGPSLFLRAGQRISFGGLQSTPACLCSDVLGSLTLGHREPTNGGQLAREDFKTCLRIASSGSIPTITSS
jgi:hypothetical protein